MFYTSLFPLLFSVYRLNRHPDQCCKLVNIVITNIVNTVYAYIIYAYYSGDKFDFFANFANGYTLLVEHTSYLGTKKS